MDDTVFGDPVLNYHRDMAIDLYSNKAAETSKVNAETLAIK